MISQFNAMLSVFCLILLVLMVMILGDTDREAKDFQDRKYCMMVKLHKTSGGVNGWPAYRSEIDCKEDNKNEH